MSIRESPPTAHTALKRSGQTQHQNLTEIIQKSIQNYLAQHTRLPFANNKENNGKTLMKATLPTRISKSVSIWERVYVNIQAWHATRTTKYNGTDLGNGTRHKYWKTGTNLPHCWPLRGVFSFNWKNSKKYKSSPYLADFDRNLLFITFIYPPVSRIWNSCSFS